MTIYMMARQRTRLGTEIIQRPQDSKKQGTNTSRSNNKCHNCLQPGHWARICPKKKPHEDIPESTTPTPSTPPLSKETTTKQQTERKCYNCHKRGHIAVNCPSAFYCGKVVGKVGGGGGLGVQVGVGHKEAGCVVWVVTQIWYGVGRGWCWMVRDGGVLEMEVNGDKFQQEVGREVGSRSSSIKDEMSVARTGEVEGTDVHDIILDTGCSQTMVHNDLVPVERRIAGEAITLRCAHGDTVLYPLADVRMEVDGISETLPVSVLLGTDVSQLGELLRTNPLTVHTTGAGKAMVVTRAQARDNQRAEAHRQQKQEESGVQPTPIELDTSMNSDPPAEPLSPFSTLDDELFGPVATRTRLTRREKRNARHAHNLVRARDQRKQSNLESNPSLTVPQGDMKQLQENDISLGAIRDKIKKSTCDDPIEFFEEDGLIYRRWQPKGRGSAQQDKQTHIQQFVLPQECRQQVLTLAHSVPLAGHLGRKKTYMRLAQCFYWPAMSKGVAEFCRTCETCQRCRQHRCASYTYDAITCSRGTILQNCNGNRYVLVVCDYGTKYPEAVPLRAIDAETVAEELM